MNPAHRVVALLAGIGAAILMPISTSSAQPPTTSLQLINLDREARVRITLDGNQVFDGGAASTSSTSSTVASAVIGHYQLDGSKSHSLIVECPSSRAKARLDWTLSGTRDKWVVLTYYPGRAAPGEPPFFTLSLEDRQALMK